MRSGARLFYPLRMLCGLPRLDVIARKVQLIKARTDAALR